MTRAAKFSDEEMLDLAAELIADRGLSYCTFRNLAARADSSPRIFTHRFGTRNMLLGALLRRAADLAWDRGRFVEGRDPLNTLLQAVSGAVQIGSHYDPYMQVYDQVQVAAPYNPELLALLRGIEEGMASKYRALIEAAIRSGQIPEAINIENLTAQIWALGDGLNIQRYLTPLSAERVSEIFTSAFYYLVGRPDLA